MAEGAFISLGRPATGDYHRVRNSELSIVLLLLGMIFISIVLLRGSTEPTEAGGRGIVMGVERDIVTTVSDTMNHPQGGMEHGPHPKAEDWTWVDAFWESLQIVLPIVSIEPANEWIPSSEPIKLFRWKLCFSYDTYARSISLLNWFLVPLFLAGISGILKKQE